MRKLVGRLVMLMFILTLLVGAAQANPVSDLNDFTDTRDHWAVQSIAQSNALGIVQGPGGNVFRPSDPVTRVDLIIMLIRALGLENEANAVRVPDQNIQFPADVTYGKGHIVLAANRKIIDKNRILSTEFRKPATRLEVGYLTAQALDLADNPTPLNFLDTKDIHSLYHGKISAIVNKGIMRGLPGNTFEPNRSVTRAEMTTVISNMLSKGDINPYPGRYLIGRLLVLNPSDNTVSVQTSLGAKTYSLASTYVTYRDGKRVNLTGLSPGQNAVLVLDGAGKICYLAYTTDSIGDTSTNYTGTIQALRIESGQIKMDLGLNTGSRITLGCSDNPKITQDGVSKNLSDTIGLTARISVVNGLVTQIELTSGEIEGTVVNLRTTGTPRIRVELTNGTEETYYIASNVTVKRGSTTLDLDDVREGDLVELTLNRNDEVSELKIKTSGLEGTVTYLRTSGTQRIRIELANGTECIYYIASNVTVKRGSTTLDLDGVREGDVVEFTLNRNDEVSELRIKTSAATSGTLSDLNLSRNRITVERSSSSRTTYDLASNVSVKRGSTTIDLERLMIGAKVEVTVSGDRVTAIKVTDDQNVTIEGEIRSVDTSRERITIRQSSGNEFQLYFEASATIRDESGRSLAIRDLVNRWEVRLQLRDGNIRRLDVIDT